MKNEPKRIFITLILAHLCLLTFSQDQIKGLVIDTKGNPVPYAIISKMIKNTNKQEGVVLSDSLGRFTTDISTTDSLYLHIGCIGYKSLNKKINIRDSDKIIITLEIDPTMLNEIVVSAQKRNIKIEPDRLIYDMSSNPLEDDNTIEALKFVPLVSSNGEGFSIIGKDKTEVYINGRKSNMNGEALTAYLRSLPAARIKNIEVIMSPNATFRGEGNFGIINIQMKGNDDDGIKGTISGNVWKTHYFKERGEVGLSFKKNSFIAELSLGATNSSDWKENTVESIYKRNNMTTNTNTITDGNNLLYFVNLKTDYQLSTSQSIGFVLNTSLNNGNWNETGLTKYGQLNSHIIDSLIAIDYSSKSYNPEVAVNANYRNSFNDSKQYFYIDFDYLNNYNKYESKNIMSYANENNIEPYSNFKQITPQKTNIWSGKVEYGNNFENILNLKTGIDSYYSEIKNDDKYQDWSNDKYITDTLRSNNFKFKEWTSALFFHLNKIWNEKLSTSLGTRMEYTKYEVLQYTSQEYYKDNYTKFLPSLYINYSPSDQHKFNYTLSYRISRPHFNSLNPFITYTSPNTYRTGNPFLKASERLSQNFQYLLLNKYYITLSYATTNKLINSIEIIKDNNLIERKPVNLGKGKDFAIQFNTNKEYMNGKANINLNISGNWTKVDGNSDGVDINYTNTSFSVYLNNYFQLSRKHNLSLDIGVAYYTKQKYSNVESPSELGLNFQIRKRIRNWQLGAYCRTNIYIYDSKFTQKWRLKYNTEDLHTITYKKGESTSIGIRVSYNFGNTKVKEIKERNTSNSEVKSRIKSNQ